MRTLIFVAILAAAPDAGVVRKANPRKFDGLTAAEGLERCRQQLPACKRPWAEYLAPPSPCAGRGALCTPELMQREQLPGEWRCGCDECARDADCGAGRRCAPEVAPDPCTPSPRSRLQCEDKPKEPEVQSLIAPCPSGPDPAMKVP